MKGNLCLGLGVANRSRVLVLVFINLSLYKKNNFFGFSSQVGEILALVDSLYYVSFVSLWFMHWYLFNEEHYNNLIKGRS